MRRAKHSWKLQVRQAQEGVNTCACTARQFCHGATVEAAPEREKRHHPDGAISLLGLLI
jgi:hypothetical protein